MAYSINHVVESGYVELVYDGNTSMPEVLVTTAQAIQLQKETGVLNYLIDASTMVVDATYAEVYQLPTEEYPRQGVNRATKIAIIRSNHEDTNKMLHFYEMECINRGWNARTFSNRKIAMNWLG